MQLQEFLDRLRLKTNKGAKKSQGGYVSCCPAHDDSNPSLSIAEDHNGKILLKCFAGCSVEQICIALGLNLSDLFFASPIQPTKTIYSYTDENGQELYRKIRVEHGLNGKAKSFYSEHTTASGKIVSNLQGCRRVLYRLPEVLKAIASGQLIYLVEGEKDADRLAMQGLVATTSLDSLKWPDEFTETLKGANVIVLYDMDKTGLERRDLLRKTLQGKVRSLRVVDLPGLTYQESHGADISDWLAMGHTTTELLEVVAKISDDLSSNKMKGLRVVTMNEFLAMKLPSREMLLSPIIPMQGLILLYAKRGVGKTHVALGIAQAVSQGGSFLGWKAPQARKVLYIDGEMPASSMQERLRRMIAAEESGSQSFFQLITPDLQEGAMPDLSKREGREAIEEAVSNSDLIIIDNLSCLFRSGIENEAESWQPAQDWALELRRQGKSILFVHHAGKGGQQRGTSKKEDILDTVINLKQPEGYRADQGACFEVIYEKTRHFSGEEARPFRVQLRENETDKLWHWDITDVQGDPAVIRVAELTKKGYTIQEIMQEASLSKSKVETRQKKARELGLIG